MPFFNCGSIFRLVLDKFQQSCTGDAMPWIGISILLIEENSVTLLPSYLIENGQIHDCKINIQEVNFAHHNNSSVLVV